MRNSTHPDNLLLQNYRLLSLDVDTYEDQSLWLHFQVPQVGKVAPNAGRHPALLDKAPGP